MSDRVWTFLLVFTLLSLVEGRDNNRRSSLLIAPYSQDDPLVALYLPAKRPSKCCRAINATLTDALDETREEKLHCSNQQRNGLVWWRRRSPALQGDLKLTLDWESSCCPNSPQSAVVLNHTEVGQAELQGCRQTEGGNSVRLLSAAPRGKKRKLKIQLEKPESETMHLVIWVVSTGHVIGKSIKKGALERKVTVRLSRSQRQQPHRVVVVASTASREIIAFSGVLISRSGKLQIESSPACSKHSLADVLEAANLKVKTFKRADKKPSPATEPAVTSDGGSDVGTSAAEIFPRGESRTDGHSTCSPCSSCLQTLGNPPFLDEEAACLIRAKTRTIPTLRRQRDPPPSQKPGSESTQPPEKPDNDSTQPSEKPDNKSTQFSKKPDKLEMRMTDAVRRMLTSAEGQERGAEDVCGNLVSNATRSSRWRVVRALCQHCKEEFKREVKELRQWLIEASESDTIFSMVDDVIDACTALDRCSGRGEHERILKRLSKESLSPSNTAKLDFLSARSQEADPPGQLLVEELVCKERESVADMAVLQAAFSLAAKLRLGCPKPRHCACLAERVVDMGPDATWEERLEATWASRAYLQWVQQQKWMVNLTLPDLQFSLPFNPSPETTIISVNPPSTSTSTSTSTSPPVSPSISTSPPVSPSTSLPTSDPSFVCPSIIVSKTGKRRNYQLQMTITSWGQNLDFVVTIFPQSETPKPEQVENWNASGNFVKFTNVQNITEITSKVSNTFLEYEYPFLWATDPQTNASCVQSFQFSLGTPKLSGVCTRDEGCCCDAIAQRDCFKRKTNDERILNTSFTNGLHVRRIKDVEEKSVRIWDLEVIGATDRNSIGAKEGDVIQYVAAASCPGRVNWDFNQTLLVGEPIRSCSSSGHRCSYLFHGGSLIPHEHASTRDIIDHIFENESKQRAQTTTQKIPAGE